MKIKLFKNEHYDQQNEKDVAYIKQGFKLVSQKEQGDIIKRKYIKS